MHFNIAVSSQTVMILVLVHFGACLSSEKQEADCFIFEFHQHKKIGMEE